MECHQTTASHASGSQQYHKMSIAFLAGQVKEDNNTIDSYHTPARMPTPTPATALNLHHRLESFGASIIMAEVRSPTPETSQRVPSPTNHHLTTISGQTTPSNAPRSNPFIGKRSSSKMLPEELPAKTIASDVRQSSQASVHGTSPQATEEQEDNPLSVAQRCDPPQTHDGTYYCNIAPECSGQYSKRRCEYRRHMNKHDRPYRCLEARCLELSGFTISANLRRHEREIHGKHGGQKQTLRKCPVSGCKRRPGKGFARQAHLNKHLRCVHGIRDGSQLQNTASAAIKLLGTPLSHLPDIEDANRSSTVPTGYPGFARRGVDSGSMFDYRESELEQLKADMLRIGERICRRQETDAQLDARLKSFEDGLARLIEQSA